MYFFYKLFRNLIRAMVSDAAPWQIAAGAFLGTLIGFLPLWPITHGYAPAPLGVLLLCTALVINVHLASVFLFLGMGKLLSKVLEGPAVVIGGWCDDLARASANIPFLHHSLWDHTGYLGLTMMGFVAARVTGETDVTPTKALGPVTQLLYGFITPGNLSGNIMSANVTGGIGLHAADLLTTLKTGWLLGANPRVQFYAQLFGVVAGAAIVVPAFCLLYTSDAADE